MKLGMSCAAFYGRFETEDAAAHLNGYGLDTCEVFLETPSEYSGDFGRIVRDKLNGLHCTSVHPMGTQFEQQLFGRSPRQVEDAFRLFTGVCDAGQAMGARYYVWHGPFGVHAPLKPERIWRLAPVWARMQEIARARGMEVLWENVHWCALRTPEDARTLQQLLGDVSFVLDVKQAWLGGVEPLEMLRAMNGLVRHVHALDVRPGSGLCLPGEGAADWPGLLTVLKESGFDGAVILEPYAQQAEDDAALRRSIACLRQWLRSL